MRRLNDLLFFVFLVLLAGGPIAAIMGLVPFSVGLAMFGASILGIGWVVTSTVRGLRADGRLEQEIERSRGS